MYCVFVLLCPPCFSRGYVSLLLSGAETKRKTALPAFNKLTNTTVDFEATYEVELG